jgi:hypothetical protein
MLDIIFSYQFAFSFAMSIIFIMWQYVEYKNNSNDIELFNRFFAKKDDYQTDNVEEIVENGTKLVSHIILTDVAEEGAELKSLIRDINEYIRKSKGTVAFSIIQN